MAEDFVKSVLVASDLTEGSDEIVRTAAAVAQRAGATLHVLHVFDLEVSPYSERSLIRPTFQDRITDVERALDEQVERVVPEGVTVTAPRVVIRTPYKAILEHAADLSADLIVLGPHRGLPVADLFLGSTADRVIRSAEAPCLVVRGQLSIPLREIVVPLDLSEFARGALDVALAWSVSLGADPAAKVDVLHVIPSIFELEELSLETSVVGPDLDREVESALARVPGAADVMIEEEIVWGDGPADTILRYAADRGADLIVLATHGHGALKRALIGSVASAVVRRATCPVLLVPPAMSLLDERSGRHGRERQADRVP